MMFLACRFCANCLVVLGVALAILLCVGRRAIAGTVLVEAEGAAWHWQAGGEVSIESTTVTLALHDLTGFDGRCDAIVFSDDADFVPPETAHRLLNWRRQQLKLPKVIPDAGEYDLVVVGGGLAGSCAAVSAARLGTRVALIQNRPVLGGNNSSEVRVSARGHINLPPYPALGNLVYEIAASKPSNADPADQYEDERKLRVVQAESNLDLFLNTHADGVEMSQGRIAAVLATNVRTGRRLRFPSQLFADCTGDGTIGVKAGADFRMGRESRDETGEPLAPLTGDAMTMGASVMWYSKDTEVANLFVAGRNISVTHVALGTVRVMQTTGMMGEVEGMAAALCAKHDCLARDVYASHLEELKALMRRGVGAPPAAFDNPPKKSLADTWEVVPQVVDTPDWHLWGASPVVDDDGRVNLLVARWPTRVGWQRGWRQHSEIALYRSERPEGPFAYVATVLQGDGDGWDAVGMHNPCVSKVGDRYALFHIANSWEGGLNRHGPNQRIGLRVGESLQGPWRKVADDGLALAPGAWCANSACGVNNPAFVQAPDGRFLLYFKAMAGPDRSRGVKMGVALSDKLEGPYMIHAKPVTANSRTIEDGTAFVWGDKICLLTTDNHGILERGGGLLWVSDDGIDFQKDPVHAFHPLRGYLREGIPKEARMHYGQETKFERPQMLVQEGRPALLYLPSGTSLDGDAGTDVHLLRASQPRRPPPRETDAQSPGW